MKIHAYPWTSMDLHGYLWIFLHMHFCGHVSERCKKGAAGEGPADKNDHPGRQAYKCQE